MTSTDQTPNGIEAQVYVARMASRPALGAFTGLLASFPVVKVFASNAVPLFMYREKVQQDKAVANLKKKGII